MNAIDILRWPGVIRPRSVDVSRRSRPTFLSVPRCSARGSQRRTQSRGRKDLRHAEAANGCHPESRGRCPARAHPMRAARRPLTPRGTALGPRGGGGPRSPSSRRSPSSPRRPTSPKSSTGWKPTWPRCAGCSGTILPAGRRLDFLMQELNREANTLGAKSIDTGGVGGGRRSQGAHRTDARADSKCRVSRRDVEAPSSSSVLPPGPARPPWSRR